MKAKPISPAMHGFIDYVFSAALIVVPRLVCLNKKAVNLYTISGINTALYSAFTNYPLGIKRVIPYKMHCNIDYGTIGTLTLATLYKPIRKNKNAMVFNISMITAAIITVALTDWDA